MRNNQRKAMFARLNGRGYKKGYFYKPYKKGTIVFKEHRNPILIGAKPTDEYYLGRRVYIDKDGQKYIQQSLTVKAIRVRSREKEFIRKERQKKEALRKKVSSSLDAERGVYEREGKYYYEGTKKEIR